MRLRSNGMKKQNGLSLVGFVFFAFVFVGLAIVAMKVVPTVVEYMAVKKAIVSAKETGGSVREIQQAFDKQRDAGYISSVSGQDLEITRTPSGFDISVAYQKKIGLVGPASLVIDYTASTGKAPKGAAQ